MMNQHPSLNVYGEPLVPCSESHGMAPKTGFFRDGCCNTCDEDQGMHTVCVQMSSEFLAYSKSVGNDLSTPAPEYDFPGLHAGDRWCLCALRWLQAHEAGAAPKVYVQSTHIRTLEVIDIQTLKPFAIDLS